MNLIQKRYDKAVKYSWQSAILLILLLSYESYISQLATLRLLVIGLLIVVFIISLMSVYFYGKELVIYHLTTPTHNDHTKVN